MNERFQKIEYDYLSLYSSIVLLQNQNTYQRKL